MGIPNCASATAALRLGLASKVTFPQLHSPICLLSDTPTPMHSIVTLVALCLLAPTAHGYPKFVTQVPNGANVPGVKAIGHVDVTGGGPRNQFGKDFAANGASWNVALCQLDSDGDGATNGEELGDPCCLWKVGGTPTSTTATSPGTKNTFTPAQLTALKCPSSTGVATTAPGGGNTTMGPTGTTSAPSMAPSSETTAPPKAPSSATTGSVSLGIMTAAAVWMALD